MQTDTKCQYTSVEERCTERAKVESCRKVKGVEVDVWTAVEHCPNVNGRSCNCVTAASARVQHLQPIELLSPKYSPSSHHSYYSLLAERLKGLNADSSLDTVDIEFIDRSEQKT